MLAEALDRKVEAMKNELGGPSPSPLERLLIERVAACWLQLNYADAVAAQARDVSLKQAELALRRQAKAHKCYLTAIGALATVRRLLPAVAGPPGSACSAPVACVAEDGPGTRLECRPLDPERRPGGAEQHGQVGARSVPLALFDSSPAASEHERSTRLRERRSRPAS